MPRRRYMKYLQALSLAHPSCYQIKYPQMYHT
jgi:hypothetical protein